VTKISRKIIDFPQPQKKDEIYTLRFNKNGLIDWTQTLQLSRHKKAPNGQRYIKPLGARKR